MSDPALAELRAMRAEIHAVIDLLLRVLGEQQTETDPLAAGFARHRAACRKGE